MKIKINDENKEKLTIIATIVEIAAMIMVVIVGLVYLNNMAGTNAYNDGYKDGYEQGEKTSTYIRQQVERS